MTPTIRKSGKLDLARLDACFTFGIAAKHPNQEATDADIGKSQECILLGLAH